MSLQREFEGGGGEWGKGATGITYPFSCLLFCCLIRYRGRKISLSVLAGFGRKGKRRKTEKPRDRISSPREGERDRRWRRDRERERGREGERGGEGETQNLMAEGNAAGGEKNLSFFRPARERGREGEREGEREGGLSNSALTSEP